MQTVSASIFKVLGSVDAIQDISYGEKCKFHSKTMKLRTNSLIIPTKIPVGSNENVFLDLLQSCERLRDTNFSTKKATCPLYVRNVHYLTHFFGQKFFL